MSDEDMIRRGDVIDLASKQGILSIGDLRAIPAVQPSHDVAVLIEACDAMVNNEDWGTIIYTDRQMWVDADNVRAALARLKGGAA